MSKNPSALASLTANYTDSENEEGHDSDDNSPRTEESTESQVIFPVSSKPSTPVKTRSVNSTPSKVEAKSGLRLVSYHDDTVLSDDENDDDRDKQEEIEMETSDQEVDAETEANNENEEPSGSEPKKDRFAEYGFSLPPEPRTKCPQELQDKITKMYEKMKTHNMDMNKIIQERKEFRNPSIYEKLIQYCEIDELGTNYPPEIYDPRQWTTSKESFYEELAKAQKSEMDKREKELSKNEMVIAATKKAEEEAKKRKSKWDQPAPSAVAMQQTNVVRTSGLITTSITGTKGTVISAFGSLPKKSKS